MPSRDEILKALEAVIDPELRRSIVELEMVRSIDAADGLVRVTVSLTTPGCPIRSHFETAVRTAVGALPGVRARRGGLRRPLRPGEGRPADEARPPRRAAGGRAGPGLQRRLHRLGQGRRRQVDDHRQPGRGADRRRQARRRPGRRRLGLLDPAHVRRLGPPARLAAAQDHAARGPRREGHVDRLLRRGGQRRGVARADAPQGPHAVPRGRRVGRAGLPARRPARRAPATSR